MSQTLIQFLFVDVCCWLYVISILSLSQKLFGGFGGGPSKEQIIFVGFVWFLVGLQSTVVPLCQEHGYDIHIATEEISHISGCDSKWSADLSQSTRDLIYKVYHREPWMKS